MKAFILALMFYCGSKPRVDLYAEKPWRLAYLFEQYCYEPIF